MKVDSKNIIRLIIAILAISAVISSISFNNFNIFQSLTKFTYTSNVAVGIVLIMVSCNYIPEKNILIVLPQIMLTYVVFALVLSRGIQHQPIYSLIEHYIVPLYLLADYFFFVKERQSIYKVGLSVFAFTIIYMIYIFSYGYVTGYYPYFFIDLNKYSLMHVSMAVCAVITLVFIIFGLLVIIKDLQLSIYRKILERRLIKL